MLWFIIPPEGVITYTYDETVRIDEVQITLETELYALALCARDV